MTKLEAILQEANTLSAAERDRLVRLLMEKTTHELEEEEVNVGQRGLAAWTESTQHEDWHEFASE